MNYYKRHIGDYMKDASHLSLLEHGVYMRLLDVYYTREGAIPEDQAARLIGARSKDEKEALHAVATEFFTRVDGKLMQPRCEAEIAHMQAKAETNRAVGKRGGRPKKETQPQQHQQGFGNPNETQTVSENNPNKTQANSHKPITNNQEESLSSKGIGTPRAARGDDDVPDSPGSWIDVFGNEFGVDVDHRSMHDRKKFFPLATAWVQAGVTVGQMREAVQRARQDATEPIAYLPAYADRVLSGMQAPLRQSAGGPAALAQTFRERDHDAAANLVRQFAPSIAAAPHHPPPRPAAGLVIDVAATPAAFPSQPLEMNHAKP